MIKVMAELNNERCLFGYLGLTNNEKTRIEEIKKLTIAKIEIKIAQLQNTNQFKTKTKDVCDMLAELSNQISSEKLWFEYHELGCVLQQIEEEMIEESWWGF